METMTCRYPGDPPVQVLVLNGAEFLQREAALGRPREMRIGGLAGPSPDDTVIPIPDIICDSGNELIAGDETCYIVGDSRLYCQSCFDTYLKDYTS